MMSTVPYGSTPHPRRQQWDRMQLHHASATLPSLSPLPPTLHPPPARRNQHQMHLEFQENKIAGSGGMAVINLIFKMYV